MKKYRYILIIYLCLFLFAGCCKKIHKEITPSKNIDFEIPLWKDVDYTKISVIGRQQPLPSRFRTLELNCPKMHKLLAKTLSPGGDIQKKYEVIGFPLPDSGFAKFSITETPAMDRALLEKFPGLRTYGGQGVTEPTSTAKIDFMPNGFHGYLNTLNGAVIIQPFSEGDTLNYLTYYKQYSTEIKRPFEQNPDTSGQRK
jgi:hypothetical protein